MIGPQRRKNMQQLFVTLNTEALREEQRRTLWAIFVVDRCVTGLLLDGSDL
ncbi:hypothetical protein JDV02_004086 [Purpureocillium takamizusanense]|uniref:Transcription factor domain-containing protein n=1 Tax=Purpureocillium takamizusanense TaxID=2060973 RepID=A0A9Q8VAF6_9HYPO|nr:uncharacterized protein JDV02_004086 [Purpureocillium takamizusanense]UNI17766.1 hypothetical protein JDV02_004086 [Purpureocillium takamizusanense]